MSIDTLIRIDEDDLYQQVIQLIETDGGCAIDLIISQDRDIQVNLVSRLASFLADNLDLYTLALALARGINNGFSFAGTSKERIREMLPRNLTLVRVLVLELNHDLSSNPKYARSIANVIQGVLEALVSEDQK